MTTYVGTMTKDNGTELTNYVVRDGETIVEGVGKCIAAVIPGYTLTQVNRKDDGVIVWRVDEGFIDLSAGQAVFQYSTVWGKWFLIENRCAVGYKPPPTPTDEGVSNQQRSLTCIL